MREQVIKKSFSLVILLALMFLSVFCILAFATEAKAKGQVYVAPQKHYHNSDTVHLAKGQVYIPPQKYDC